tara:strand:+ start:548 stop:664 length:117 start_codon:yes stop_codon:yes gene_type:complete
MKKYSLRSLPPPCGKVEIPIYKRGLRRGGGGGRTPHRL